MSVQVTQRSPKEGGTYLFIYLFILPPSETACTAESKKGDGDP